MTRSTMKSRGAGANALSGAAKTLRRDVAGRSDTAPAEVLLVVLLGVPERCGRNDLGDDRALVATRLLEPLLRRDRRSLLLGRVIEDHRPVVVADVWTLAIELRWIVVHPEDVEQR